MYSLCLVQEWWYHRIFEEVIDYNQFSATSALKFGKMRHNCCRVGLMGSRMQILKSGYCLQNPILNNYLFPAVAFSSHEAEPRIRLSWCRDSNGSELPSDPATSMKLGGMHLSS